MYKFKKNITVKVACVTTEFLISISSMVIIMFILLIPERMNELFYGVGVMFLLVVIINLVLFIISSIAKIFIKTTYLIEENILIVKNNNKNKQINFDDVGALTYDLGELSKYGRNPSKLVIFDKDYKQILSIDNPPLVMVHVIRRKCNDAKLSYSNSKRFLFFFLMSSGIAVFISIISLFSK